METFTLVLKQLPGSVKKHSVRFDAGNKDKVTAFYVNNEAFADGKPAPKAIKITVEAVDE